MKLILRASSASEPWDRKGKTPAMSWCVPGSYIRCHSCCGNTVTPYKDTPSCSLSSSPYQHHPPLLYLERSRIQIHPTAKSGQRAKRRVPEDWPSRGGPTIKSRGRHYPLSPPGLTKRNTRIMNSFESFVCFIEFLRKRLSTTKVLLTSPPQAEVKEILGRLSSIEYDKERKGLICLVSYSPSPYRRKSQAAGKALL